MVRRGGIVDEPLKQPMVLPKSVLNKFLVAGVFLAYLSVRPFFGLVLPKGVPPNEWKNSGIRGDSGHARAALLVDPVPPVFAEQTYWDHYSVASRAGHHLMVCAHTSETHTMRKHTCKTHSSP